MGFNYDKIQRKTESDQQWSSYSDLFMALSVIFLLLYVTTSIRGGAVGIDKVNEVKELKQVVAEQKAQLQAFRSLKEEYLQTGASSDEQAMYDELMEKISLLKEETDDERKELEAQAAENQKKVTALNQYQKLVASIVNANMVAQSRIQKREKIIKTKDQEIKQKRKQVRKLERTVSQKKKALAKNERVIKNIESELEQKLDQLRATREANKISEDRMKEKMAELQIEAQKEISQLELKKLQTEKQLYAASQKFKTVSNQLESAQTQIKKQSKQTKKLQAQLEKVEDRYQARMDEAKAEFEKEREKERENFQAELKKEKLTAIARAKRQAQFAKAQAEKRKKLEGKLANLGQQMRDTQAKMKMTEGELAKTKELANARKRLAQKIKRNFAKAGIKADVNAETGDVTIDFGENFFRSGSAQLKREMRSIIEKAMPVYSKSLLGDRKVADKVKAVEIVGFASPTYQGKYVDPTSLDPKDKKAIEYNMDLSYKRAKSIFNHVFDTEKLTFQHQKKMLPLVKVTGRAFFAEGEVDRSVASGTPQKEFCKKYDCKKSQKVLIKFDLEN